jgi:hypothetical protein
VEACAALVECNDKLVSVERKKFSVPPNSDSSIFPRRPFQMRDLELGLEQAPAFLTTIPDLIMGVLDMAVEATKNVGPGQVDYLLMILAAGAGVEIKNLDATLLRVKARFIALATNAGFCRF